MKPLFIIQPLFLGDIFFSMKIASIYAQSGHRVIFPIYDEYGSVLDSVALPNNVEMPLMTHPFDSKSEYDRINAMCEQAAAQGDFQYHHGPIETDYALYLPLNTVWRKTFPSDKMRDKYDLAHLDHTDWADYVHLKRNPDREAALYRQLGITDEPFILLNEIGRTNSLRVDITGNVVRMSIIPGFSMFDWSLVIERAAELITIDTAVVLLAEVLKPRARVQVFSRYVPGNLKPLDGVLRLNWHLANSVTDLLAPIV